MKITNSVSILWLMLDKHPLVSIILPAYNEAQAVSSLIADIKKIMAKIPGFKYEIIVVDDASTDKTAELGEKTGAKVIRHLVNRGSGASRKTGIREAKGEIILMMDVDGTYSPNDIPKILAYFPKYDQIIGWRKHERGSLKILRFIAKYSIRKLAGYLVGENIPDLNSGMRAFKKETMLKYLWLLPNGFSCVTTMTMAFLANNHNVKWIPISYSPRIGKSKFRPLEDTYNYILTVIRMVLIYNPLKIFVPIGSTFIILALIKGFWTFSIYGQARMLELIFLMIGFFMITIGLMADLIVTLSKRDNER